MDQMFQFTRPRGARPRQGDGQNQITVSIHAPTGGATTTVKDRYVLHKSFNSRAHGGRDYYEMLKTGTITVSIHAPTGGATEEGRLAALGIQFQFTRPRGARPG